MRGVPHSFAVVTEHGFPHLLQYRRANLLTDLDGMFRSNGATL